MSLERMFNWLVMDHITRDWPKVKKWVENGKYVSPLDDEKPILGETENEAYGGILIMANGAKLASNLKKNNIIKDSRLNKAYEINNYDALSNLFNSHRRKDGAEIYDSENCIMRRVMTLNNSPFTKEEEKKNLDIENNIPKDFGCYDSSLLEIGNKTYMAITLPQFYPSTHTFQIKRTFYTPLGTGLVTHFDKEGLVEDFHLEYKPDWKGDFIDPKNRIVGIHRTYNRKDSIPKTEKESYITTSAIKKLI